MRPRDALELLPGFDPFRLSKADKRRYRFEEARAERAIRFFHECCRHTEDSVGARAGELMRLEPWQQAVIANAFGWVDRDGFRRFREVFIYIPRKNGKTTLAAGFILLLTFCDGEFGAQVYSAATSADQASIVYNTAKEMVLCEPALNHRAQIFTAKANQSITYPAANARFEVLSKKPDSKHGFNVHGGVIDEVHAHPSRELIDVIRTGTGSRRQPLLVYTTTAGFHGPTICNELLRYARGVLDGSIKDPHFLPVVYEACNAEEDGELTDKQLLDPKVHAAANPNLGVSVSKDYMLAEARKAINVPAYRNTFLRLGLNVVTQSSAVMIKAKVWAANRGRLSWKRLPNALRGRDCILGLDLSSSLDMTAVVAWFADRSVPVPFYFAPRECTSTDGRSAKEQALYDAWEAEGALELHDGNVIDYPRVLERIRWCCEHFNVLEIAYDPYNATLLVPELEAERLELTSVRQGWNLSPAVKELLRLTTLEKIKHGGHPVLAWNIGNAKTREGPTGNLAPDKIQSAGRIDGVSALVTAISRTITRPKSKRSVYARRGIKRLTR